MSAAEHQAAVRAFVGAGHFAGRIVAHGGDALTGALYDEEPSSGEIVLVNEAGSVVLRAPLFDAQLYVIDATSASVVPSSARIVFRGTPARIEITGGAAHRFAHRLAVTMWIEILPDDGSSAIEVGATFSGAEVGAREKSIALN